MKASKLKWPSGNKSNDKLPDLRGEREIFFLNTYIGIHVTEKSEQDPSIPKYLLSILCGARFGIITSVSQVFYSQIKKLSTIES